MDNRLTCDGGSCDSRVALAQDNACPAGLVFSGGTGGNEFERLDQSQSAVLAPNTEASVEGNCPATVSCDQKLAGNEPGNR